MPANRRPHAEKVIGLAVLAGVSAALAGCASLPPNERQVLIEASRQYTRGETMAAMGSLDRIIRDYGRAAEIGEAYYIRGLCRFRNQQDRAAGDDFEQAIAHTRRADLTAQCKASLAAIAMQRGDYARAADLYAESVPRLRDVPPTDSILYSAGIAMQRAGQWSEARLMFARILNRFRDRPVAEAARRMASWRHPFFSLQFGAFRDSENAGRAVAALRADGFDAVQEYLPRNGQNVWVVTAGHYQTYAEARTALDRVRKRQADASIIP